MAAALILQGCGGGGAGDAEPTVVAAAGDASAAATISTAAASPPPPATTAPTIERPPLPAGMIENQAAQPARYVDGRLAAAVDHLNAIRTSLGLGALLQHDALDRAAQSHVDFLGANGMSWGHGEAAGLAGFTGVIPLDRVRFQGYAPGVRDGFYGIGEVGAFGAARSEADVRAAVDGLVSAIYHRMGVLNGGMQQVGAGLADLRQAGDGNYGQALFFNFGIPEGGRGQRGVDGDVVAWPRDGASVPGTMAPERPMPMARAKVGYPVSVHSSSTIEVTRFELLDAASGVPVPVKLVTRASDSPDDGVPRFDDRIAALVPLDPLPAWRRWNVRFEGRLDGTTPVVRSWSFSTACSSHRC